MTNYQSKYKILHWVMTLLILVLIPVGLIMADLPDNAPNKGTMYELHKSFGFVVLLLAILRVVWRRKVAPLETLTSLERKASTAVHHLLFALIIIMPVTGYLATSSCCAPLKPFDLFNIAFPFYFGETITGILFKIHNYAGKLMALLILMHIGAALYHHFVKKDGVLKRMLK